jgi:hypothetical protein
MLSELCSGDAIDDEMLHDILKDRRGLYTTTVLPSGEIVKNYRSISFHTMAEHERAKFIDWAFETLSKWLIVESQPIDITALIRREIQQRDWEQVMIQGDKRAPVFLPDRIRRLWR